MYSFFSSLQLENAGKKENKKQAYKGLFWSYNEMVRPRGFEPLTQWLKAICSTCWAKDANGAQDWTWTSTVLRPRDFKSLASTYFATWAIAFS
ncbi:hypothetical protein MS53_0690 [Mycoplasmopsis synoviae 53]|uniref:Uncharacterized protein n=1 Tax=Mycoplasmopsis synoviae (strain 53) TaxID=262723 RepID=A4Q7Z4_MYCS5|nr:hypothetical protein MS53_0690 [Mycoplasmopsis synoviae 53]